MSLRWRLLMCLGLALVIAGPLCAQPSTFEPPRTDPAVAELESLLGLSGSIKTKEEGDKYLEKLRAAINKLSTLRELELGLRLRGWAPPPPRFEPMDTPPLGPNLVTVALKDLADRYGAKWQDVLKGDDATQRRAALTAIATRQVSDPGGGEVFGLSYALARLGPRLLKLADGKDAGEDAAIVRTVGALPANLTETGPALAKLLKEHKEKAVRAAAAEAIGKAAQEFHHVPHRDQMRNDPYATNAAVIEYASVGLSDEAPEVQRAVLKSVRLAVKPAPESPSVEKWTRALALAIPGAAKSLGSTDKEVALEAARLLEHAAMARKNFSPKGDALKTPLVAAVPALGKALLSKEVEVQLSCLYALERLEAEAEPALDDVVKACDAKDGYVRWAAVRVLGRMAPKPAEKAVPALVGRFKDDNADVRATAILAVGLYGAKAKPAVSGLALLTKEKDLGLRLLALEALERIGKDAGEALDALIDCLQAKETKVRVTAVRTLAKLDDSARMKTALARALDDEDADVRRLASEILLRDAFK